MPNFDPERRLYKKRTIDEPKAIVSFLYVFYFIFYFFSMDTILHGLIRKNVGIFTCWRIFKTLKTLTVLEKLPYLLTAAVKSRVSVCSFTF